jgi:hypothetical protein
MANHHTYQPFKFPFFLIITDSLLLKIDTLILYKPVSSHLNNQWPQYPPA